MCHVLRVNRSGYYAWLKEPLSDRARENQMIVGQIKQAWLTSGKIYGYRKIHDDLQDLGLPCGEQRVYRLMKAQGLRSQTRVSDILCKRGSFTAEAFFPQT